MVQNQLIQQRIRGRGALTPVKTSPKKTAAVWGHKFCESSPRPLGQISGSATVMRVSIPMNIIRFRNVSPFPSLDTTPQVTLLYYLIYLIVIIMKLLEVQQIINHKTCKTFLENVPIEGFTRQLISTLSSGFTESGRRTNTRSVLVVSCRFIGN